MLITTASWPCQHCQAQQGGGEEAGEEGPEPAEQTDAEPECSICR